MMKAVVAALMPALGALGGISAFFGLLDRHRTHRRRHPQRRWKAIVVAVGVVFVASVIFLQSYFMNRVGQTASSTTQAPNGVAPKRDVPAETDDAGRTPVSAQAPTKNVSHRRALAPSRAARINYPANVDGPILQIGGGDRSVTSNVIGGGGNSVIAVPGGR